VSKWRQQREMKKAYLGRMQWPPRKEEDAHACCFSHRLAPAKHWPSSSLVRGLPCWLMEYHSHAFSFAPLSD
jgi:hypothetical protein